jgi:hypothetical protein
MNLTKTYNLTKYKVEVFSENDLIDPTLLDSLNSQLDNEFYPKGIIEILEVIPNVKRIIVYSLDDKIIVHSTNGLVLEEYNS